MKSFVKIILISSFVILSIISYVYIKNYNSHPNITIIAGGVGTGYDADPEFANKSPLNTPEGIAFDRDDNLYIADSGNNAIRKVDAKGMMTTVIGDNDGRDLEKKHNSKKYIKGPSSIACSKDGEIYFTESSQNQIMLLNRQLLLSKIVGTGEKGFSGDGGLSVHAKLNDPRGIILDKMGNCYVADSANNRIRKIDKDGIITTIAGTGKEANTGDSGLAINAALNFPSDLAINKKGEIYIIANMEVRKIDLAGIISTLPETSEGMCEVIAIDGDDNVYLGNADGSIWFVNAQNKITEILAHHFNNFGFYPPQRGSNSDELTNIAGIAINKQGYIYISDSWGSKVVKLILPTKNMK